VVKNGTLGGPPAAEAHDLTEYIIADYGPDGAGIEILEALRLLKQDELHRFIVEMASAIR